MNYKRIPMGPLQTNCYIITTENNNGIIIDPGVTEKVFLDYLDYMDKSNITIKKILLTHGHFDHIFSVSYLKKRYGCEIYIGKSDVEMLCDNIKNLANDFHDESLDCVYPDFALENENFFELDDISFKIYSTPGHTKGSVIYVNNRDKIIFSGDTIFKGFVGRTDLYSGNSEEMIKSLEFIATFDDDFKIFGGHEEETTLFYEKQNNKYFSKFTI